MLHWLVILLTLSLSGVAATRTSTCEKTQFDTHIYPHLLSSEPRLKQQLELIRKSSQQTGKEMELTNCHVTFPVDKDAKIVDGQWNVIIDHVWETRSSSGATRQHQAGIRLVFDEEAKYRTDPKTCDRVRYYDYSVRGVTYCWGPDGCTAMGIPFPPNRDMRGRARWRWPTTTTKTTVIYESAPVYCPTPVSTPIYSSPIVTSPVVSPFAPTTIYYVDR